jgi:hypothetical protein
MKRWHPSNWHPRAVQVFLVWLAAWPTLSLILSVISPFTANWPVSARALASATAMAPTMNLISVPLLKAILRMVRSGFRRMSGDKMSVKSGLPSSFTLQQKQCKRQHLANVQVLHASHVTVTIIRPRGQE